MANRTLKKRLGYLGGCGEEILSMAAGFDEDRWRVFLQGPLDEACKDGNRELVLKLVLAGARPGYRAFFLAASEQKWDVVVDLCSKTPSRDLVDVDMEEVLYMAIRDVKIDVIRALLDVGGAKKMDKALITAVRLPSRVEESTLDILNVLLKQPRALEIVNHSFDLDTPLIFASMRHLPRVCSLLLSKGGADVNARRTEDVTNPHTALYVSTFGSGCLKTTRVLLEAGAGVNIPCGFHKRTVIHYVAEKGGNSSEELPILIEYGGNVGIKDTRGVTPLHLASGVAPFRSENIRILVEAGADVNAKKRSGRTPLHSASSRLNVGAVKALLWHGADETVADRQGQTPMDVVGTRLEGSIWGHVDVQQCVNNVKSLLEGAPGERAWRRRKAVVMCRACCGGVTGNGTRGFSTRRVRRSSRLGGTSVDLFAVFLGEVPLDVFRRIVLYL